jgi:hypothetical protein
LKHCRAAPEATEKPEEEEEEEEEDPAGEPLALKQHPRSSQSLASLVLNPGGGVPQATRSAGSVAHVPSLAGGGRGGGGACARALAIHRPSRNW